MKKIITLIGVMVLMASIAFAQAPDNRTTNTVVVDLLAQSPFNKQKDHDKAM